MRRFALLLTVVLSLAGCAGQAVWAPDEDIRKYGVAPAGQPKITLITVMNLETGNGGHSALLVDAPSQRVLFDPAGSFHHPRLPERNDVIYGMKDAAVDFYIDYHSRQSWKTHVHEVPVSAAVAEAARRAVEANGPTPNAFCANHISTILSSLPGFEAVKVTMFPENIMAVFETLPGVRASEYHDNDPDENGMIIARGF